MRVPGLWGRWLVALAATILAGGCLRTTSHTCESSAECGPEGLCEPGGACSFPAADCPGGRRYGEGTGPLAGQCVVGDGLVDASDPDGAGRDAGGDAAGIDAPVTADWGDGHHGDLTVGLPVAQLNSYGTLDEDASAGATTVVVSLQSGATVGAWPDDFVAGDRIMLWHTTGLPNPAGSGSVQPTTLDGDVGRWFVTRVTAVSGPGVLTLASPLPVEFPRTESQVIKLPELRTATISLLGRAVPAAWAGSYGGLVGLYADTLIIDGAIDASGRGFRGSIPDNTGAFNGCTALDGRASNNGGARKGESLVPSRFGAADSASGRGNIHHGGGGGDCHNAGGGGGGGGGAGGSGGDDIDGRAVGGMGGQPIALVPATHLTAGGGGGAGERHHASTPGSGGTGGGVVFVVARTITCNGGGAIASSGGDGGDSDGDGGGGGGAGGLVWVRAGTISGCSLLADGGRGGDSAEGPGGGGGGGAVVISGVPSGLTTAARAGGAGNNGARGATAGMAGVVAVNQ